MGQNRRENSVSRRNRVASTAKLTGGRRRVGMGGGKDSPTSMAGKKPSYKPMGKKAGGKVDVGGMKKMKSGGQCRGKGAAKRGYNTSKKMG